MRPWEWQWLSFCRRGRRAGSSGKFARANPAAVFYYENAGNRPRLGHCGEAGCRVWRKAGLAKPGQGRKGDAVRSHAATERRNEVKRGAKENMKTILIVDD